MKENPAVIFGHQQRDAKEPGLAEVEGRLRSLLADRQDPRLALIGRHAAQIDHRHPEIDPVDRLLKWLAFPFR